MAVANHAVLIAVSIAFAVPVIFMALTAVMSDQQALSARLIPAPVRLEQLQDGVRPAGHGAAHLEYVPLRGALHRGRGDLLRAGRIRVRPARVERAKRRVPAGAGDADAAHPGDLGAAVHPVGAPVSRLDRDSVRGHAEAADHPQLLRRRVLDLPAAPVLHDHPQRADRRHAGRRRRRVPDPDAGGRAAGQAGDRRRRRCSTSSTPGTTSTGRWCTWPGTPTRRRSRSRCRRFAESTTSTGT